MGNCMGDLFSSAFKLSISHIYFVFLYLICRNYMGNCKSVFSTPSSRVAAHDQRIVVVPVPVVDVHPPLGDEVGAGVLVRIVDEA